MLSLKKNRDLVFDALKLFAIFMVLWGHAIQWLSSTQYYDQPVYRIIYSFHMPLFMTIVGYFSVSNRELSVPKMILKKARQLLLPAVSCGIILYIIGYYESGKGTFGFWFLKSAFCCGVLYYLGKSLFKKPIMLFIITLLISQVIYTFKINLMYPCFLFGVFLNRNIAIIRQRAQIISLVSGAIFLIMLLFWDSDFWLFPYKQMSVGIQDNTVSYYFIGYRIVIGLIGALFFLSLFITILSRIRLTNQASILISFGQETLGIYLIQTFLLETFLPKILNLDNLDFTLFNFVVTPLISLVVLVMCLVIINLIKKSSVLSLIFLGRK